MPAPASCWQKHPVKKLCLRQLQKKPPGSMQRTRANSLMLAMRRRSPDVPPTGFSLSCRIGSGWSRPWKSRQHIYPASLYMPSQKLTQPSKLSSLTSLAITHGSEDQVVMFSKSLSMCGFFQIHSRKASFVRPRSPQMDPLCSTPLVERICLYSWEYMSSPGQEVIRYLGGSRPFQTFQALMR